MFIADIIEDVLNSIPKNLTPLSKTQNTEGKWEVIFNEECNDCKKVWLSPCKFYKSGTDTIRLLDIQDNVYIFDKEPLADIEQPLHYFHGRKVPTNAELNRIQGDAKFPLVYLFETLQENYFDNMSRYEKESTVNIFFLDNINQNDWKTDDHYTNVLYPIKNLVDSFINEINRTANIGDLQGHKIIPLVNFGNYDKQGALEWIFDNAPSSGLKLEITLPIVKTKFCKSKC